MKKLFLFISIIFILTACKKDDPMVTISSDIAPAVISAPATGMSTLITSSNLTDQITFSWSNVDYGIPTQITYTVQIDSKCNSFTNPIIVGTSNTTSLSITLDNLNTALVGTLRAAPHQPADLQVRVTSVINGKYMTISDPVAFKVTPYSDKPVALWLGENSPNAPVLYATSGTTYEGYRFVKAGTSFRFSNNPICADSVFGYAGAAGKLAIASTAAMITMPKDGYYKFNVDTKNLTFDTLLINSWGMIGSATSNGWNSSTPMNYDVDKDTWSATITLASGALKFRANGNWDVNYGPAVIADLAGNLIQTNDAINIAEPGVYAVSIDFSQSKAPYLYNYTVTKSSDIPEPSKLWLPGGYQSYSPSTAPFIYATGDFTYEGYVYISSGTGFKFTSAPDWVHTNYGYGGAPGTLSTDGLANDLSLGSGGFYKFNADVNNLTYSTTLVNTWGMIGTATPGGWNTSSPMTYDQTNNVWTATIDLVPGALKFRANDAWDLNYGPAVIADLTGELITTNDAVNITTAGTYTVTLDFSRSQVPYQYTYSVKMN